MSDWRFWRCNAAMAYGGEASAQVEAGRWTVTGRADKLVIDPVLWDDLRSGRNKADITPAQVQFALLPTHIADAGLQLTVDWTTDQVRLRF